MKGLGVCGLGKLGAPIAAVFAAAGVPVVCYDHDPRVMARLAEGSAPVAEPYLESTLRKGRSRLAFASSPHSLAAQTDACIFVLPTPSLPSGDFDHSALEGAIAQVAAGVAENDGDDYGFVVTSTVMPGWCRGRGIPTARRAIGNLGFGFAYKPELIALGTVLDNLVRPDFHIFGADSLGTLDWLQSLYLTISGPAVVRRMPLLEAELAKISLNCAVTMRISFANQVGAVADRWGADSAVVLDAVGEDHRVGHACMVPGLPFGGPCFPRDNRMFLRVAEKCGVGAPLARATDEVNEAVLARLAAQIPDGVPVGILGMAYKVGTEVTEESAGTRLQALLERLGHKVVTHDPTAHSNGHLAAALACRHVVIACPWPEYRSLRFRADQVVLDPAGLFGSQARSSFGKERTA